MIRPAFVFVCLSSAASADVSCNWVLGMPLPDVVIVGEVHDNPLHHQLQACVITALMPGAAVFEMLSPDQAVRAAEPYAATTELAEALDWEASGWPPFELYSPVFEALAQDGQANVPIFGAEVPREEARRVFAENAAAVFGTEAQAYGLTELLPADQQSAREALQLAAHCDALPPEMLPGFVEAQRLRDARLAQVIVQAYAETGGPVIVITGNGHARTDWGVPAVLAQAAPDLTVFSVGQIEGEAADDAPYDLVLTSPVLERPDPCAAFDQG